MLTKKPASYPVQRIEGGCCRKVLRPPLDPERQSLDYPKDQVEGVDEGGGSENPVQNPEDCRNASEPRGIEAGEGG